MILASTSAVYVIAGGIGTGAAAFVVFLSRFLPRIWNHRNPEDQPISCGKADTVYVRKEVCELARGQIEQTLHEIKVDVRAIMQHQGVPPPNPGSGN